MVEEQEKIVIPEFTKVKTIVLEQYFLAQNQLSVYSLKPSLNNELLLRGYLINLANSLSLKTYVLKDSKDELEYKSYFQQFISNPNKFQSFDLHTIYSICHLIMEKLGHFNVESEVSNKENVFNEV